MPNAITGKFKALIGDILQGLNSVFPTILLNFRPPETQ